MIPWVPWTLAFEVGPAIAPEGLFRDDDPDLDAALTTVEGAVQGIVADDSARER